MEDTVSLQKKPAPHLLMDHQHHPTQLQRQLIQLDQAMLQWVQDLPQPITTHLRHRLFLAQQTFSSAARRRSLQFHVKQLHTHRLQDQATQLHQATPLQHLQATRLQPLQATHLQLLHRVTHLQHHQATDKMSPKESWLLPTRTCLICQPSPKTQCLRKQATTRSKRIGKLYQNDLKVLYFSTKMWRK